MSFETITFGITDQVARIGLNRSKVLNALNRRLVDELAQAVSQVGASGEIRAAVVIGEGENFAAGADVSEMVNLDQAEAAAFGFSPTFNALADLPIPVIAAVDGFALGGGLELAMACDLRICTSKARFGLPEIKLGIFPGAGGTQRLPRLIGQGRARELIYTGRIIDAETALNWGLCNKLVSDDLEGQALQLAARIVSGPPLAMAGAKHVISSGAQIDLAQGIALEAERWSSLFSSHDQKEGMLAFIEKRKPVFTGR